MVISRIVGGQWRITATDQVNLPLTRLQRFMFADIQRFMFAYIQPLEPIEGSWFSIAGTQNILHQAQ
jgi:hypothetical protein